MIEEKLENFRKEYLKIGPSVYLEHHGWQDLSVKLESRKAANLNMFFGRGLAFTSLILLLLGGVVGVAQASKPGDKLYPVKLAADEVAAKVTGNVEIKIERRAQDVIDVSKDSKGQLDEATKEYQKSLENSKEEAQRSGRQKDFADALDEQEKRLRKAKEDNPESADELQEAIMQTQRVRGEVKGEKTEDSEEKDNSLNHSDDEDSSEDNERSDHSD